MASPAAGYLGATPAGNADPLRAPQHRLLVGVLRADAFYGRNYCIMDRDEVRARLQSSNRGLRANWLFERAALAKHALPLHSCARAEFIASLSPERQAYRYLPFPATS